MLVCLGNTGSGKSTILASLVHGKERMTLKQLEVAIGKKKMTRYFVDCTEPNNIFKIGHSKFESETFIPKSQYDEKTGITFADVAGLNATAGGTLIEIVNNFLVNYMFKKAKRVRFVLPITSQQVTAASNQELKKQLDTVMLMANASVADLSKAMLPLITKVTPSCKDQKADISQSILDLRFQIMKRLFQKGETPGSFNEVRFDTPRKDEERQEDLKTQEFQTEQLIKEQAEANKDQLD